jgi:hypothetical protein
MRHRVNPWFKVGVSAWSLGLEASSVIAMRSLKIAAGGPQGEAEAQRMVAEKIDASLALQAMAMTGALGASPAAMSAKTLAHYRKKVRANRRRLAKG